MTSNTAPQFNVTDEMVREHHTILATLEKLERTNRNIQRGASLEETAEHFEQLARIAKNLLAAEPHHQREEQVLFPELDKRGITGPTSVMRHEHELLRRRKHQIDVLAQSAASKPFKEVQSELNEAAIDLVYTLREHIAKENNILYPMAQRFITEPEVWEKMRQDAEQIGGCDFHSL